MPASTNNRSLIVLSFVVINAIRNLIGILRSKLIAVYWGVASVGVLGQLITLLNFQSIAVLFSVRIALVNQLEKAPPASRPGIVHGAALTVISSNLLYLTLVAFFSTDLSLFLFKTTDHKDLIIWLALLAPVFSISEFLSAIYQAQREFRHIFKTQVIALGGALLAVGPLTYFYGVHGVILDLFVWYGISLVLFLPGQWHWFRKGEFSIAGLRREFAAIFKISFVNIVANLAQTFSLVVFRGIIVQLMDIERAGYFQAIWSVANYVNILIQGFLFYFHPTISAVVRKSQIRNAIDSNFTVFQHLLLPVILFLLIGPQWFLWLLFSSEYTILKTELCILLLGKFCELIYLYLVTVLISQNMFKRYLGVEITRVILQIGLPYFLIADYGFAGGVWAVVIVQAFALALLISVMSGAGIGPNRAVIRKVVASSAVIATMIFLPNASLVDLLIRLAFSAVALAFLTDIAHYRSLLISLREYVSTKWRS